MITFKRDESSHTPSSNKKQEAKSDVAKAAKPKPDVSPQDIKETYAPVKLMTKYQKAQLAEKELKLPPIKTMPKSKTAEHIERACDMRREERQHLFNIPHDLEKNLSKAYQTSKNNSILDDIKQLDQGIEAHIRHMEKFHDKLALDYSRLTRYHIVLITLEDLPDVQKFASLPPVRKLRDSLTQDLKIVGEDIRHVENLIERFAPLAMQLKMGILESPGPAQDLNNMEYLHVSEKNQGRSITRRLSGPSASAKLDLTERMFALHHSAVTLVEDENKAQHLEDKIEMYKKLLQLRLTKDKGRMRSETLPVSEEGVSLKLSRSEEYAKALTYDKIFKPFLLQSIGFGFPEMMISQFSDLQFAQQGIAVTLDKISLFFVKVLQTKSMLDLIFAATNGTTDDALESLSSISKQFFIPSQRI